MLSAWLAFRFVITLCYLLQFTSIMSQTLKSRTMEWLYRYGPPEVGGILGTLASGLLFFSVKSGPESLGLGGTIGELAGFYGVVISRELWQIRRKLTPKVAWMTSRNLVLEFGMAELVDSLFLRPLFIDLAERATGRPALSLLAGKLTTDLAFYLIAISMYEWLKRKGYRTNP
jgi:hypothetical protein